jgi:glycosyltransferase involved in cell wall biosynthesis
MRADPKPNSKARFDIILNGRFLSAASTGVHRVGRELIWALDRILPSDEPIPKFIIATVGGSPQPLNLRHISVNQTGWLRWQFWEQISLPRFAKRRLLVNLCNLAPVWRPGVIMIHDAQVHISPKSYSKAFAAFYKIVQPIMARRAVRVLTVSAYSKAMLVKYGVAPADKITVIHNGVDHILRVASDADAVARLGLVAGRYVVALATTQAHKNVCVLIAAFADPALADATLVLVGAATADDFARAGHACPPNVVFAGRVSDGVLRALLEDAACLAFPSTTEGFGLPPMEAMILGCPAVVAPCGALPEVCGGAAVYADPHDPAAWAKTLARFVDDPQARATAGEAARLHAGAFTWARSAAQLLDVLTELQS